MSMPATLTPARCTARTARAAHNDDTELWTRAEVEAMLAAQAAGPADPMDMPLPCDVKVGHGTMRKGVPLRTLVARMKVLYEMATGENADKVAGRTLQQRQELFQSSTLAAVAGHDAQPCRDCADFGPICPSSGRPCGTPAA